MFIHMYGIASNGDFCVNRIEVKATKTKYRSVDGYYLYPYENSEINKSAEGSILINSDEKPSIFFVEKKTWLAKARITDYYTFLHEKAILDAKRYNFQLKKIRAIARPKTESSFYSEEN